MYYVCVGGSLNIHPLHTRRRQLMLSLYAYSTLTDSGNHHLSICIGIFSCKILKYAVLLLYQLLSALNAIVQMNVQDSNVVRSILKSTGYKEVGEIENADAAIANTCSIRENAESKVRDFIILELVSLLFFFF